MKFLNKTNAFYSEKTKTYTQYQCVCIKHIENRLIDEHLTITLNIYITEKVTVYSAVAFFFRGYSLGSYFLKKV